MGKKYISLLLCFLLLFACVPMTASAYTVLPMINIFDQEVYDKGTAWLANQDLVEQYVAAVNNLPEEDDTLYTIAKNSVIIRANTNYGYIKGYRIYMDKSNTELNAIIRNDTMYVPLEFANLSLEAKSVVYDDSSNKVTLVVGSKTITTTPIIENEYVYIPVRQVAEDAGKTVHYDFRGVVVVTDATTYNKLTVEHLNKIAHPQFMLDRDKIVHPIDKASMTDLMKSYPSGTLSSLSDEKKTRYVDSSYLDLLKAIDEDLEITTDSNGNTSSTRYVSYKSASNENNLLALDKEKGGRPAFESTLANLANEYESSGNEEYALRVVLMTYHYALRYDNLLRWDTDSKTAGHSFFRAYQNVVPIYAVYAYDKTFHSPMWDVVSAAYGTDIKEDIVTWWTTIFNYMFENRKDAEISNYENFLPHMAQIARVLDNPEMVHKVIKRLDKSIEQHRFYADGMWYEGSSDYAGSSVSYADNAASGIDNYRERRCYTDSDGIKLDGSLDVDARWSKYLSYTKNIKSNNRLYFPDGSPIALNDVHYDTVSTNLSDFGKSMNYTEASGNIELNHFGLYGLRHGDSVETQQINISMQATSSVSHQHTAPLGISYYSGGVELLPDIGYVDIADNRYAKITISAHNTAHASELNPSNPVPSGSYYLRPNVLAYDNGADNDKAIQLIEGSNLMHSSSEVDINRRALMMIETEGNRSYLVDIHRIKGAQARESYLIQTEEETVTLGVNDSLGLPAEGAGDDVTLPAWLSTQGKDDGYVATHENSGGYKNTSLLVNPRGLKTSDDFWFTWKGNTTGTTLKAFIKGNDNSLVAFSQWPTNRAKTDTVAAHDGYHFYRSHNPVNKEDVTTFGAIYEGYKNGETAIVTNVEWIDPADGNDMTTMVKVTLSLTDAIYYDYIYISDDLTERKFGDFTFKGSYAMVRTDEYGAVIQSYVYGEGEVKQGDTVFNAGGQKFTYNVASTQGSHAIGAVNTISLKETPTADINGLWGSVNFSDGSGTAFKIKDVNVNSKNITINNNPGFKITETGAEFTAYPMYEDANQPGRVAESNSGSYPSGDKKVRTAEGTVTFTVKTPNFSY